MPHFNLDPKLLEVTSRDFSLTYTGFTALAKRRKRLELIHNFKFQPFKWAKRPLILLLIE